MKFVVATFSLLTVVACTGAGNSPAPSVNPDNQQTTTPNVIPAISATPVESLSSKLAGGQKLVIVLNDAALVSKLNEISGKHATVAIESGSLIPGNDGSKGWCELATGEGFVNRGDRFEVAASNYTEKVYLGSTRSNIKASEYLYFQCQKGGMDQTPMLLNDLKTMLGALVSIDIEN